MNSPVTTKGHPSRVGPSSSHIGDRDDRRVTPDASRLFAQSLVYLPSGLLDRAGGTDRILHILDALVDILARTLRRALRLTSGAEDHRPDQERRQARRGDHARLHAPSFS